MIEYIKIDTPYARSTEGSKKLIEGNFRDISVYHLRNNEWCWSEKIDGTNISVEWDGHEVSFHGRTERAEIPKFLQERLEELFGGETNEELFEQMFGGKHVILYGEGYGGKIQQVGKLYREECNFILFDVYLPEKDLWLEKADVEDIALALGIMVVPNVLVGDIKTAVEYIKTKPISLIGKAPMEGVVGTPLGDFKDRQGKRIIVKVKARDFE